MAWEVKSRNVTTHNVRQVWWKKKGLHDVEHHGWKTWDSGHEHINKPLSVSGWSMGQDDSQRPLKTAHDEEE